jgi:hypothetical protein
MAPTRISTVRLDEATKGKLSDLKTSLRKENGLMNSREQIVRALIWGITPAQVSGMLTAYIKHAEDEVAVEDS